MSEHDALFIHLESAAFEDDIVHVVALNGRECIGQLFAFDVTAVTRSDDALDVDAVRGADIAIVFSRQGAPICTRHGMVVEVIDGMDVDQTSRRYQFRIEPHATRLKLVHTQDILLDHSWPDAISNKLSRVALKNTAEMRLYGNYDVREFLVQYDESDLAFVSRLAEHAGISFFFEHDDGSDHIVFCDANEGFAQLGEPVTFRPDLDHDIYLLRMRSKIVPKKVVVQDYNYRTPTVELTGFADVEAGFAGGVAEFGPHHKTPAEADAFARLRAEQIHAGQRTYEGESDRPDFMAGLRVEVSEHPHLADPTLLLTTVIHEAKQSALGHGTGEQYYRNRFEAASASRPYRPPRITPRPRMTGFFTGLVQPNDEDFIGPAAELDDDGRYRVRMCFDIKPREGSVSRPVRMAQPHSGAGHGMHFPLRPGVEVAVVFANGDPDRPIIVGALDNPATPSPTVSKNSRQNILSTASGIKITLRDNR